MTGRVVVKVGTSSLTNADGSFRELVAKTLASQIAKVREDGTEVVMVVSGAIALGLARLGLSRPQSLATYQACAAVGQIELAQRLRSVYHEYGVEMGQILLAPHDFGDRQQYLHARQTLEMLLSMGVLPVINENDAIANEEIRFGDNDRLAALIAHLVYADLLILLTDIEGVFTTDPRLDSSAYLLPELDLSELRSVVALGAGTDRGSGGMASKVQAAEIAARSGVDCLIAAADKEEVILRAVSGEPVGTKIRKRGTREAARKLWIAYAATPQGRIVVDEGAKRAIASGRASLLPVGVRAVQGEFLAGTIVEIADQAGSVFAKGIVKCASRAVMSYRGEVVHRDDLANLTD